MEATKVTLEGIAEGNRPELIVQEFLTRLKSDEKLADYIEEVKLVSLARDNLESGEKTNGQNGNPD